MGARRATSSTVIIAGAGIGGLTAALCLAKAGFASTVLERERRLSEAGAGIQLSPNASRVFAFLGLEGQLREVGSQPDALQIFAARSGQALATIPIGKTATERYGAPYWSVHRADLQRLLLDAAEAAPQIDIRLSKPVARFVDDADGIAVHTTGDEIHSAAALIGADGRGSRVRELLLGDGPPTFSGYVAWRGLVAAPAVPEPLRGATIGLWLGSNAHLVHYPVKRGDWLNIVAVTRNPSAATHWSSPAEFAGLEPWFHNWASPARQLLAEVSEWRTWSLFDRTPAKRLAKGRVALIGDAAHPMLPFMAQGGAMAIEDGAVIAGLLGEANGTIPDALQRFETLRLKRVARVQREARHNANIYHLAFPAAQIRNQVIAASSGNKLLGRYDWLYGFDPLAKVPA